MTAAAVMVSVGERATAAVAGFEDVIECGSMAVDFAAVVAVADVGIDEGDEDWDGVEDYGVGDDLITWAEWEADERCKMVEVQARDFRTARKSL
ncbi:hypothetical protein TcWFU_004421 [Taenia crassiceps]|uniref:Uncharacterized protein n=1 Tax=Taenia crassiceps TaxID=6207 RepID=A0ABR4QLG3_9CEST